MQIFLKIQEKILVHSDSVCTDFWLARSSSSAEYWVIVRVMGLFGLVGWLVRTALAISCNIELSTDHKA